MDFPTSDPIEIIKRLMIGSEGTLGFVSQATYNTVIDHPHKASAFIVFKDVKEACRAAAVLRRETKVDAVELFDRASLTQCEGHEQIIGLVPTIATPQDVALISSAAAPLTRSSTPASRRCATPWTTRVCSTSTIASPLPFNKDEAVYKVYGARKGLIPLRLLEVRGNLRAHRGRRLRG